MSRLAEIGEYWNRRAAGFSMQTNDDLRGEERAAWLRSIQTLLPAGARLRALDVGCGPGFFAILLAELGHAVTAFDFSENMLAQARANAANAGADIVFQQGDAQALPFADGAFDLVISRNLMWNLERPADAYREWVRVLAPGGALLNCDGNHFRHLHDADYALEQAQPDYSDGHNPDYLVGIDPSQIAEIARDLPLSRVDRPQWDVDQLIALGLGSLRIELGYAEFPGADGRAVRIVKDFVLSAVR